MTNLIPRPTNSPIPGQAPEWFSRTESKALSRQQNAEVAHGLVVGTRVQAAGMVAAVGLQITGMLSREAAFQSDGDPKAVARLDHIVDRFAEYVGAEVARFRF